MPDNTLYYGNNLDILRGYIRDESVDLIYLDPPFNSKQAYNVIFSGPNGSQSEAQIRAFDDTWHWDHTTAELHDRTVESGGPATDALVAFRHLLGTSDMMAYLANMAPRLLELHRVLKPAGSMYLHCDEVAAHYLKVLLDGIFGAERFRTEIIWQRTNVHSDSKCWSDVRDSILFYTKSSASTWNPQHAAFTEEYVQAKYGRTDPDGRRYMPGDMTSPHPRPNMMYEWRGFPWPPCGWRYQRETMQRLHDEGRIWYPTKADGTFDTSKRPRLKRYLDEMPGVLIGNVWTDIPPINSQAQERLGYPTQKPEALLERIIAASSNEGDVVLDPFCGCGTTIAAAARLNRRWIGIDITHLAISLIKHRLQEAYGDAARTTYAVIGEPADLEGARALARDDPYQFQWWALGLVGARPIEQKKGADRGIDGRLYFHDEPEGGKTKQIIISVKSGKLKPDDLRALHGVISRQEAEIGVLLALADPTRHMLEEAASAGFYSPPWDANQKHPRLQIITISELLAGGKIKRPYASEVDTFIRRAPKAKRPRPRQPRLPLPGH